MPRVSRLSFELLETFVRLVDNDGRASLTARQLGVNAASMSKRLARLHRVGPLIRRPWLARAGKRWRLTKEGRELLPAAQDLVRRYDRLREALEGAEAGPPPVAFACGQQTAADFVCEAVARMYQRHPDVRLRITTLRGLARVQGVVNGSLDLALVSWRPEAIEEAAGRPLYTEDVFEDPLLLAVGRAARADWARRFAELPEAAVGARDAATFPLILPGPDADTRRQLDRAFRDAGVRDRLQVALEIGGWPAVLAYCRRGLAAAVVPLSAQAGQAERFRVRRRDPRRFAPRVTRLICRRLPGSPPRPDLTPHAALFADLLREAAAEARAVE